MNRSRLTKRQRERLELQLRQTRDIRLYRRTLALLERDRGRSVTHIARMLGVHRTSVHRWLEAFEATGDPAALEDEPHRGRPRLWTPACAEWLNVLMHSTPEAWGWEATGWTAPLLQAHVVVGAHTSEHRDLLTAQPGHPPAAVLGQAHVVRALSPTM